MVDRIRRSWLIVPAHDDARLGEAVHAGADVIASATGVQPIGAWRRATSRGLLASYDDTLVAAMTGRQAGFKGALCLVPVDERARITLALAARCAARDAEKAAALQRARTQVS